MPFPGAQIGREPAQAAGEGGLSCTGQHGDAGADGGVEVGLRASPVGGAEPVVQSYGTATVCTSAPFNNSTSWSTVTYSASLIRAASGRYSRNNQKLRVTA
jgi:hypothetical protein